MVAIKGTSLCAYSVAINDERLRAVIGVVRQDLIEVILTVVIPIKVAGSIP